MSAGKKSAWIVMENTLPLRWSALHGAYVLGRSATVFASYAEAQKLMRKIRIEYWALANAAPSPEHPAHALWVKRAKAVRVVRIQLPEVRA